MTDNSNKESQVYQLTEELLQTQRQKKASNSGFNEEIKRLKKEIEDLVEGTTPSTESEE